MEVNDELAYEEVPVDIIDQQTRQLRNKSIPMVKVLRRNRTMEECTWESEAEMRQRHPSLFINSGYYFTLYLK